jgi:hypothetical protein
VVRLAQVVSADRRDGAMSSMMVMYTNYLGIRRALLLIRALEGV